jgi:hypothetical protein
MTEVDILVSGIAKSEPGSAAIGVMLLPNGPAEPIELVEPIGNAFSDFAVYQGVLRGLDVAREQFASAKEKPTYVLHVAHETVRAQLLHEETVTHPALVPQFIQIHNLRVIDFPQLTIATTPHPDCNRLDKLVRKALDA